MLIVDIESLSNQDKIELIRKLLESLPSAIRKDEIERANRIENNIPAFLIETPDGRTFKASTPKTIALIIEELTGKTPNISNIYKVIRKESKTIYGLTIKKFFEGE